MSTTPKAVVLGAYGLIGAACARQLTKAGFHVIGVGRSVQTGRRTLPGLEWLERDIARTEATRWRTDLEGVDVLVNAAGALQDGARDDLTAIHETTIAQLVEALDGSQTRFIQISAAGVRENASTAFFRTKARGDAILMASNLDWIVLRPTLVIGAEAYGGTALLRAQAATPFVHVSILPEAPIQTVALDDVAEAVAMAAKGKIASGTVADLTASEAVSFAELTKIMRRWLGFPAWRHTIALPRPIWRFAGRMADGLGWLGWRSPLRTTALRTLERGVRGEPAPWLEAGGKPMKSLEDTLSALPATMQERRFATTYLWMPVILAVLSLFWLATGIITLFNLDTAVAVLTPRGLSSGLATLLAVGGALADIVLGAAVLVRRWARKALWGMTALSAAYLVSGTLIAPELWADPLGPLLKILPIMALSLFALTLVGER